MAKAILCLSLSFAAGGLPQLAAAAKLEGLVVAKEDGVLKILDVASYEQYVVWVTDCMAVSRKNHNGITLNDVLVGWFVEVDGTGIRVKTGRLAEVRLNGYQERGSLQDSIIVSGQVVTLSRSDLVRRGEYIGPMQAGMRTSVVGTRRDDGSVEASEIVVRPNGSGIVEQESLASSANFVRHFDKKPFVVKEGAMQEYVASVGEALIPESAKGVVDFRFYLIENEMLNAFAVRSAGPSRIRGSVYVTTGLLRVLENEAQLAAVLGHEVAHITHEHMSRGAAKRVWTEVARSAARGVVGEMRSGWGEVFAGVGVELLSSAIINGYSRDIENEADRIGLRYMFEAGYAPIQAPRVWQVFREHTGDMGKVANFFYGSHSTHDARKRNLFREISQSYFASVNQPLPVNDSAYRANVLDRVSPDGEGLLRRESTDASATLPEYSGVLFVPWRGKQHRDVASAESFQAAVKGVDGYLVLKGIATVDRDASDRALHDDHRLRRLANLVEDEKQIPIERVLRTSGAIGADSVLVLTVGRPVSKWIKLQVTCYRPGGDILWEEAVAYGKGWSGKGAPAKAVRDLTAKFDERLGGDCLRQAN